jgi:uncharacterized membrane protein YdjX (TVP38/TMEM64 family)
MAAIALLVLSVFVARKGMLMWRWICLWLMISGVVIVIALLSEQVPHFLLAPIVQSLITEPGMSAALLIVILLSLDMLLPVPSSLVMILSGVMFGVVGGGLLSLLGLLTGNMGGFELTRRYGIGLAQRLVGQEEFQKMDRVIARYGIVAILLSRPIPVMMETLSVVAGLSSISRGTFVLANLLGALPICFLYASAGAYSQQPQSIVPAWLIGMCMPAVGWLIVQRWRRVLTRPSPSDNSSIPRRNC